MEYDCKIVDLGKYLKVTLYENPIQTGKPFPGRKKADIENEIREIQERKDLSPVEKFTAIELLKSLLEEKNNKSKNGGKPRMLKNADRERFLQLLDINFKNNNLFITLTYSQEDVSLDDASKDFENWIKRMRDRYGDFKYLGVRSFQERGTIHFHLVADIPRIPEKDLKSGSFRNIWGHGDANVKKVYLLDVVYEKSRLSKYFIKNLQEFVEDPLSAGKRLFLKSKNLKEPVITKCSYKEFMEKLSQEGKNVEKIYDKEFPVKYLKSMKNMIFKKME